MTLRANVALAATLPVCLPSECRFVSREEQGRGEGAGGRPPCRFGLGSQVEAEQVC